MQSLIERLAQGSLQPNEYQTWNQAVGSVPQNQFAQAAGQAFQQVNPNEYYQHTQPGVAGTNPLGTLDDQQRSGLAQTLLSSLYNRGVNQQQIQQAGINTFDPNQMTPQQIAALAQWMQQNHPEALGQAAAQYQDKPSILSSLMGNKTLLALGSLLGAAFLANRGQGGGGLGSLGGTPF